MVSALVGWSLRPALSVQWGNVYVKWRARSRFFEWWVAWAVGSEVRESRVGLCDQTLRRQGPVTGREFDNGDNMEMTESWSREKAEQTKLSRFPCECQWRGNSSIQMMQELPT
jgi:hypothetical protein